MNKTEIHKEMEELLGIVPSFMNNVPESNLELEWKLFKQFSVEEGKIPGKYRELMGLAISATTKCIYCTYYHTQFARLFGATDEEIEETIHFAKHTAGWSTYINGSQMDYAQFKKEIDQVCDHVRTLQKETEKAY